ncbi:hypothetical protein PG995_007630 [Apiospora arundinis]
MEVLLYPHILALKGVLANDALSRRHDAPRGHPNQMNRNPRAPAHSASYTSAFGARTGATMEQIALTQLKPGTSEGLQVLRKIVPDFVHRLWLALQAYPIMELLEICAQVAEEKVPKQKEDKNTFATLLHPIGLWEAPSVVMFPLLRDLCGKRHLVETASRRPATVETQANAPASTNYLPGFVPPQLLAARAGRRWATSAGSGQSKQTILSATSSRNDQATVPAFAGCAAGFVPPNLQVARAGNGGYASPSGTPSVTSGGSSSVFSKAGRPMKNSQVYMWGF